MIAALIVLLPVASFCNKNDFNHSAFFDLRFEKVDILRIIGARMYQNFKTEFVLLGISLACKQFFCLLQITRPSGSFLVPYDALSHKAFS